MNQKFINPCILNELYNEYAKNNWQRAVKDGDIVPANPKLAMFESNKSESLQNYFLVADFLSRMGFYKTLEIFELESQIKDKECAKARRNIGLLMEDIGFGEIALQEVVNWYSTWLESEENQQELANFIPKLKHKMNWYRGPSDEAERRHSLQMRKCERPDARLNRTADPLIDPQGYWNPDSVRRRKRERDMSQEYGNMSFQPITESSLHEPPFNSSWFPPPTPKQRNRSISPRWIHRQTGPVSPVGCGGIKRQHFYPDPTPETRGAPDKNLKIFGGIQSILVDDTVPVQPH